MSGFYEPPIHAPAGVRGEPTSIRLAEITTVNADGSVDLRPLRSRGGKHGVQVPSWYVPTIGDRVLLADLDGNPLEPIVLGPLSPQDGALASPAHRWDGRFRGGQWYGDGPHGAVGPSSYNWADPGSGSYIPIKNTDYVDRDPAIARRIVLKRVGIYRVDFSVLVQGLDAGERADVQLVQNNSGSYREQVLGEGIATGTQPYGKFVGGALIKTTAVNEFITVDLSNASAAIYANGDSWSHIAVEYRGTA